MKLRVLGEGFITNVLRIVFQSLFDGIEVFAFVGVGNGRCGSIFTMDESDINVWFVCFYCFFFVLNGPRISVDDFWVLLMGQFVVFVKILLCASG